MAESLTIRVKRLEAQVSSALRPVDRQALDRRERELLAKLVQSLTDSRIYSQSYELSETRDEQLKNAREAKKWLGRARRDILKASEKDIFGPADVAHLSAQIDQIIGELR
ncbi:MAG TPA: hypothetical protein VFW90_02880 [Candidatus Saccharimonadales bacterium]|nr:hypothetical protein [Candidatus Saccharimonadales bacterium]